MILTCPACATSYFVPDDSVGANGRKVRCQSCGEVWKAVSDEPLELTATTAAANDSPESAGFGRRDEAPEPETLAEAPAPELPKAFRARAEQQRRLRRAAAHGAVWAGLAAVFLGLLASAWLFRVEVVTMFPRAAEAYAMIGQKVNTVGLDFEAVGGRPVPYDPDRVLVSGAVRNVRDNEIVTPPVRVALLDERGAEIGHAVVRVDGPPVLPGAVQGFAVMIPDPGGRAAGVGVDFAPAAKPAPIEQAARPAPAVRRAATAEEAGLRPALAMDVHAPSGLTPIQATPALDSAAVQTVSPSGHG